MIGVIAGKCERKAVQEFFQLFKTAWEFYQPGKTYWVVISTSTKLDGANAKLLLVYSARRWKWDLEHGIQIASTLTNTTAYWGEEGLQIYGKLSTFSRAEALAVAIKWHTAGQTVVRIGFNLFSEVAFLLTIGQPPENAHLPTLDLHIDWLRRWIVEAGVPLVEIPPRPAGYDFMVCLTHDVDFVRIGDHKFDHTMWGFLFRATFGSLFSLLKGRMHPRQALKNWRAALSLPLIYLGCARDFWLQFDRFLEIEKGLPSTYFVIPFKHRMGDQVKSRFAKRRIARYEAADIADWVKKLLHHGYEVAVHGIDAWHCAERGRQELCRIEDVTGEKAAGVRMHWLCFEQDSFKKIEKAGFQYDATWGYNDAIGYRSGTGQVFRPIGLNRVLEVPLIIQDTALFYPKALGLSERQAWNHCQKFIENVKTNKGVLTLLWHQRSLAPERLWDDFYVRLINELRKSRAWFGTCKQTADWFEKRRRVSFTASFDGKHLRVRLQNDDPPSSDLTWRVHLPRSDNGAMPQRNTDLAWDGKRQIEITLS